MDNETQHGDGMLVLIRHGESEWNAKNIWTGLTDIGLTPKGEDEARACAGKLTDIQFNSAFTSNLKRANETLRIVLETPGQTGVTVTRNAALNERDYGIYTGKNKLEIHASLGDREFLKLRRGWDYPIPSGESLKQVYGRVIPYYMEHIAPLLREEKHVLVVAHGNSLRALIKYLDHVSDEQICNVELATGELVLYHIDSAGAVVSRESRHAAD